MSMAGVVIVSRVKAMDLIGLAASLFEEGDPDRAASAGH